MSEVVTNVELTTGEMKYLIDSMWGTPRHDSQAYAIRHKINEVALEENYSAMLHRRSMN